MLLHEDYTMGLASNTNLAIDVYMLYWVTIVFLFIWRMNEGKMKGDVHVTKNFLEIA